VDARPGPDAFVAEGSPSCDELMTPAAVLDTVPATLSGDIGDKQANLSVDAAAPCARTRAPFGSATAGADEVIRVNGLNPGSEYWARIKGAEDLGLYVITGCSAGAPGPGQCLSLADEKGKGAPEAARFTAPADGGVWIVVDFWDSTRPPDPSSYELTVASEGCNVDADCPASKPVCDAEELRCGGIDACVDDDSVAEAASDDTLAGATLIDPAVSATVSTDAVICNDVDATMQAPREIDFYRIDVPVGGALTTSLAWADDAADLDLTLVDDQGRPLGQSVWRRPEVVALTYLPAGAVFAKVTRFSPSSTTVTPYTLAITREPAATCQSAADCDDSFTTQQYRGACAQSGACVPLVGAFAVPAAGACDSDDDCAAAAPICTATARRFMASQATRGLCSPVCVVDADCAAVPASRCMGPTGSRLCLPVCTTDLDCGVRSLAAPPLGATTPWRYGTCTPATGLCTW
jgi:hypothetical protein